MSSRINVRVGVKLIDRLGHWLGRGTAVALLGPRGVGKRLILSELAAWARRQGVRPLEIDLTRIPTESTAGFVRSVCEQLGIPATDLVGRLDDADGSRHIDTPRLGAVMADSFFAAARRADSPAWLLTRGVLDLPVPLARAVLEGLQSCRDDRIGVIVSGTTDFVDLTYGANSPFRDVDELVVRGMEPTTTDAFVLSRLELKSLNGRIEELAREARHLIDGAALDEIYLQTGGYMHLVEELILAARRHPLPAGVLHRPGDWTAATVRDLIEYYLDQRAAQDHVMREVLRSIERAPAAFDTLIRLSESGGENQPLREDTGAVQEYDLEVSGVVSRVPGTKFVRFSSPLWQRYVAKLAMPLYVAETLCLQGRWPEAWARYDRADALGARDRPATGDSELRWQVVRTSWENELYARVPHGTDAVCSHFLNGLRFLFGFDSGGVYDFAGGECRPMPVPIGDGPLAPAGADLLRFGAAHLQFPADDPRDPARLKFARAIGSDVEPLRSYPHLRAVLLLGRDELHREIDGSLVRALHHSAAIFWSALVRADEIRYHRVLGELGRGQLQIIRELSAHNAADSFDLGGLLACAARLLIEHGRYLRVQFCLVDPKEEYITAVISDAQEGRPRIEFPTRMSLTEDKPPAEWDVQRWVVAEKRYKIISDAKAPEPGGPTTQRDRCLEVGMEAITVLPLIVKGRVLGTLHVEREDLKPPSEPEIELLQGLADGFALAIFQVRQQALLYGAIDHLPDQVRIIDPSYRVAFLNNQAAGTVGGGRGWLLQPMPYRDCCDPDLFETLSADIAAAEGRPRHRLIRNESPLRAFDWHLVPIPTFIRRDQGVLTGIQPGLWRDWIGGYVERYQDLSRFYLLYMSVNRWLAQSSPEATADAIIRSFREDFGDHWFGLRWCRIYTFETDELGHGLLRSYAQHGLRDPHHREQFEARKLNIDVVDPGHRGGSPRNYGRLLLEKGIQLALCRHSPGQQVEHWDSPPTGEIPLLSLCEDPEIRECLEKGEDDTIWVEAPLLVGGHRVGLISLSLPPGVKSREEIDPSSWEILRWTVLGGAIALHNALRAKEEAQLRSEKDLKFATVQTGHRLKNKLVPVRSFLDRIGRQARSLQLSESLTKSLKRAIEALDEGQKILRQFKQFASEGPIADRRVVAAGDLLELMNRAIEALDLDAEVEVGRPAPAVDVDVSTEVFQVIAEHLAINSQLHHGDKPGPLRIRLAASRSAGPKRPDDVPDGPWVRLVVADNGPGVSPGRKAGIFEPFVTSHASGTGLGLAIVKNLIRRHGGFIFEDGTFGEGASFSIYLPACRVKGTQPHEVT